jgi:hypothetical protein
MTSRPQKNPRPPASSKAEILGRKRMRIELSALLVSAAMALAMPQTANASNCPPGTIKIGEKKTETADAIIVQPVCKKVATVPKECPPGSSVVGGGCMRDTAMRPEPSKKEKLAALRRQAWRELDEIRYHGALVSWEGIWTLLGKPPNSEAGPTAEDESYELRDHVKSYLEIENQIEELTGMKAAAQRALAERESHLYFRADGKYNVNQSKATAPGQNYIAEPQTPLKATGPITAAPYVPGDVAAPPPLTDKRPIPPGGYKPRDALDKPR